MTAGPAAHRLPMPEGELCWFEWGVPSAGRPSLLMLHATGFHARLWDATVAALPDGLHIVAPDLRGHGRSFQPERIDDWRPLAGDLTGLVDALTGPLIGIGHSMGGVTLTRLAAMRPERFARLLLVDPVIMPPAAYADPAHVAPEDHPIARRRARWASADAMIAAFADRVPYSLWRDDVLADYCRYGLLPTGEGDWRLACAPLLEASIYCSAAFNDPADAVAAVTCPVTVVRAKTGERDGSLDFTISPTDPRLAQRFSNGRDLHWPDVSHFIPMQVPERLAALIVEEIASAQQG